MDKSIIENLSVHTNSFLGYPCNTAYDYSEVLDYFKYNINNVGCPYVEGTYKVNTKTIEREVLSFFAELWGFNKDNIWGYVTSAGTEGNMQGLYVGRESLGRDAIFYTSKDSHYSLFKLARILCLNLCIIDTLETGEMDYNDFETQLTKNIDKPALINANLGTTMKGAIDNTREIYRILKKHNKMNYYLHADGALMGFVIPFIQEDIFFKRHIHSISISGHKFLGIKLPCGIFMMEKRFLKLVQNNIEYIGSFDCTISGSRNGHTPLFYKYIIDKKGINGFKKDINTCIELAEYLVEQIPSAWRNQNSITVVFPKPSENLINKWQLATQDDISHVVVMPHVTKEKLDLFVNDYKIDITDPSSK
jgi:histidine decarboxylase